MSWVYDQGLCAFVVVELFMCHCEVLPIFLFFGLSREIGVWRAYNRWLDALVVISLSRVFVSTSHVIFLCWRCMGIQSPNSWTPQIAFTNSLYIYNPWNCMIFALEFSQIMVFIRKEKNTNITSLQQSMEPF